MSLSESPARPNVARAPDHSPVGQLETLRQLMMEATHSLLADTIAVSDEEWRASSKLPRWSRAHVATHLARQADGLVRLAEWARTGRHQPMYGSSEQRIFEIAAGAGRPGLELQKDMDLSAQRLDQALDSLEAAQGWDAKVELRDGQAVSARLLPLVRLSELVLHHIDLDVGYDIAEIDRTTAEWLLEWAAFRLRTRSDFPALSLKGPLGFSINIGSAGDRTEVQGSLQRLLGWVTGRSDTERLRGTGGISLPAYA